MTTNEQRKIFAKNLAYYVSYTGKSQKDVSKDLGVNYTTFNMWMSGKSMPRMGMVQAIADYFHVRNIDLINEHSTEDEEANIVPLHPDIKDIKVYRTELLGDVACGTPIVANAEYETYIETDFDPKADHCVRARGDSMIGARIYDGDIVFIKDCDIVDNGDIAVVIIDGEVTLKRFYWYKEQNVVQLIAENPAYAPLVYSGEEIDHIKIVGKALFFQGFIK
jgi:repressor LexA